MALFWQLRRFLLPALSLLLPHPGEAATICFSPHCGRDGLGNWIFEVGAATITDASIKDFASPEISLHQASGPGAGTIYSLTAARRLGELRWEIGGHTFTPQLEVPFTLEIVDENARRPFLDFNASFTVRWVDFPWNKYVKTTFAMGIGLSYSERVYLIDQERHPGQDRSKLKFNWPIQLTLAHPDYPRHQLIFFIAHQSGGHVFDTGGVNSLGIGYRHEF
ncbi:MAG: hypothetical protein K9N23_05290 [Akkermansiaceae bacterium]|nr:hypothetical protein [Akkermansiaceae bacterium]MCF7731077.1 hypothetical protein [Akkermansiaceae bacterium]